MLKPRIYFIKIVVSIEDEKYELQKTISRVSYGRRQ